MRCMFETLKVCGEGEGMWGGYHVRCMFEVCGEGIMLGVCLRP